VALVASRKIVWIWVEEFFHATLYGGEKTRVGYLELVPEL